MGTLFRSAALFHTAAVAFGMAVLAESSAAQGPPPGYYDSVDDSDPAALRATLHQVIDDHQRFPYTAGSTDTWDILEAKQQHPAMPGRILDLYQNDDHPEQGGGNSLYNREHTWPNSYGFPDDNPSNYPYTDCHVLFLCDINYNGQRANKIFRNGSGSNTEFPTVANNGQGGGSGSYPGNSNWTFGQGVGGGWETWIDRRGDVARALLYMDVRYEGGTHGGTGAAEPDLILTDDVSLIAGSSTGNNEAVAYMGLLSVLLEWHEQDPVDAFERNANDVVFDFQDNRNPFVDHPEWVPCLFEGACFADPLVYCTAKTNSCSGLPAIEFTGAPSAGASSGFVVASDGARQGKLGLLLYSSGGRGNLPFDGGLLCVAPQGLRRAPPVPSTGGLPGFCFSEFQLDVNAFASGNAGGNPAAFLRTVGEQVNVQWWGRDSVAQGALLSDGLEYFVGP